MPTGSEIFISICIPAYKRIEPLSKLLHSIAQQSFRNFEVVVTDDSGSDTAVEQLVKTFTKQFPLLYHRNNPAAGTPQNWNEGIGRASGQWIKLMHDDDWFASDQSLQQFADATANGCRFIFSAYTNVFQETGKTEPVFFPGSWRRKILQDPMYLLPRNVIGPPSVVMVHRSVAEEYDRRLKWRVDMEFYVRVLKKEKDFYYINQLLVAVGISSSQVTNFCIDKPEVELPEGLTLLQKHGVLPLRNIRIYDAWWRIVRNVGVRSPAGLMQFTLGARWPTVIPVMVRHQARVPVAILRIGIFSKLFMAVSYIFNFKNIKDV